LTAEEERFLSLALEFGSSGLLRGLDRLALEGPADQPTLVTYFRRKDRPGLLFASEWRLRDDYEKDEAIWFANTDEAMGGRLPDRPGPDGIVRF
jgi:hypothetical protein